MNWFIEGGYHKLRYHNLDKNVQARSPIQCPSAVHIPSFDRELEK